MRGGESAFEDGDPFDADGLRAMGQEIARNIRNAQVKMMEECFGHPLDYLIEHPEVVESFANHPESDPRAHVLAFFTYYGPPVEARARLVEAIHSDGAHEVRGVAVCLMGEMFGNTGDLELLALIKDVARDEREDDEVRKAAYLAVTHFDRDQMLIDPDAFEFPNDADWEFFDRVIPLHDPPRGRWPAEPGMN